MIDCYQWSLIDYVFDAHLSDELPLWLVDDYQTMKWKDEGKEIKVSNKWNSQGSTLWVSIVDHFTN